MKGMRTIFCKELKRVFKDPKMIFSLFVLPVILMVGIYGLMGYLGGQEKKNTNQHIPVVSIQNAPDGLKEAIGGFLETADVTYLTDSDSTDGAKDGIYSGTTDLLVVFPKDFAQQVSDYESTGIIPDVHTFYNPSENYSQHVHDTFTTQLNTYQQKLLAERFGGLDQLTVFTIDESNETPVIQDAQKASGQFLGMMLPYLVTILLFAGTMSLGTDSITGEKERGTMASMLVTPVNRLEIALGKLLALMTLSILSASVYIIALTVSLPKTLESIGGSGIEYTFGPGQLVMIAVIILSLSFLYVTLVGIVSVFAKTVKEATSYVTPLYLLVIVSGLFTIVGPSNGHAEYEYLIPIYNCSIALSEIFTNELTMIHFVMTFGITLVVGGIITAVIAKAFSSERTMFNA